MSSFKFLIPVLLASLINISAGESGCGGVINAESGSIDYKLNESLHDTTTCIWTINVLTKIEVEIQLTQDGFTSDCLGCQILAIYKTANITNNDVLQPAMEYNSSGDRNLYTFSGSPVIQVILMNNNKHAATGFSLAFKGVGKDNDGSDPWAPAGFQLFDQNGASSGVFRYPPTGNSFPMNQFAIFALQPEEGKHVALTLESFNISTWSFLPCNSRRNTFIVQEITKGIEASLRFRECKTTREPLTIYSGIPLIVSYAGDFLYSHSGFLQFSWKMVDPV